MSQEEPIDPDLARIDAKSAELIQEFKRHLQEVSDGLLETHGWMVAADGGIDEQRVFEAWIIQKLAGTHVAILDLNEQLQVLVDSLMDDSED